MPDAVEICALSKSFGKERVLRDISAVFESGMIHGIVGRNGSGKTVLMKCVLGFLRPTGGHVVVLGRRIGRDAEFAPDTGMMIDTPG
ncbi:MAG: ATP-binding cassette domain-containing protein, partial [Christensenellales bacterium]